MRAILSICAVGLAVDFEMSEPRMALVVDGNPWIGPRSPQVYFVSQVVNGSLPRQSAGATRQERLEDARRLSEWLRGVSTLYRAEYQSAGMRTRVHALRFATPESAAYAPAGGPLPSFASGTSARIVMGRDIARVSTPDGPHACYDAVRRYLESLR